MRVVPRKLGSRPSPQRSKRTADSSTTWKLEAACRDPHVISEKHQNLPRYESASIFGYRWRKRRRTKMRSTGSFDSFPVYVLQSTLNRYAEVKQLCTKSHRNAYTEPTPRSKVIENKIKTSFQKKHPIRPLHTRSGVVVETEVRRRCPTGHPTDIASRRWTNKFLCIRLTDSRRTRRHRELRSSWRLHLLKFRLCNM